MPTRREKEKALEEKIGSILDELQVIKHSLTELKESVSSNSKKTSKSK